MAIYRVHLCGRHLQLDVDEERQELGFHTTRFVEATSEEAAGDRALVAVAQHPAIATQVRERTPNFAVFIEGVEPLPQNQDAPSIVPGLVFFPEGEESPLA